MGARDPTNVTIAIKRIIDTHGGKVELSNKPLGGLEAKVLLPLKF